MRVGISNIAWDVAEDETIAAILIDSRVDAIDIAPGKYFPRPLEARDAEILALRRWWRNHGIEITGMQALLFGTSGLNVFGAADAREAMLAHLAAVCRIAGVLGARRLVFGSPRNRDRSGLDDEEALAAAVSFFRRLGDIAAAEDVFVCLEPNPVRYGSNFMTNSADTAAAVRAVAHPAIRMQLDAGAITLNGEDPEAIVAEFAPLIGHVHASEPDLAPLGDRETRHDLLARSLARHLPDALVSIEMVATPGEPHAQSIGRALKVALGHYRDRVGERQL